MLYLPPERGVHPVARDVDNRKPVPRQFRRPKQPATRHQDNADAAPARGLTRRLESLTPALGYGRDHRRYMRARRRRPVGVDLRAPPVPHLAERNPTTTQSQRDRQFGAPGVSEGKCTVSPITLGAFQEKEAVYL